jgi:NitT/TauT family transport system substrate-binding protein
MFQKREIDAAWAIEPWVSRLQMEGGGRVFLEESSRWPQGRYVTTHLIVRREFLEKNRGLVRKLIAAHVATTQKINADRAAAAKILNAEIKRETGKALSEAVIQSALRRVEFTWDPLSDSLFKNAADAHQVGFYRQLPDLSKIYDLSVLNEVLLEKKLPPVPLPSPPAP